MLTVILTAVEASTPLFPGPLMEWTTEQYALLRGAIELKNEHEAEQYEKTKKEADEKAAIEAEKRRLAALPPGSKSGGGGAEVLIIETPQLDWDEEVDDGDPDR